jgi:hypothetical protein
MTQGAEQLSRPQFPFPDNIQESIDLLNASNGKWNLSIARRDGTLYIYDGDQVMFIAKLEKEVLDFLSGAFLATFYGMGLDQIKSEITFDATQFRE